MAIMRHSTKARLMARIFLAAALLGLATPAYAARDFRIGSERFTEADILDARALPSADGMPVVMITLTDAAAPRLKKLTEAMLGKVLPITLDGKQLTAPIVREAIPGGVLEISGLGSFPESEQLALKIAGKPPLPDSLEE